MTHDDRLPGAGPPSSNQLRAYLAPLTLAGSLYASAWGLLHSPIVTNQPWTAVMAWQAALLAGLPQQAARRRRAARTAGQLPRHAKPTGNCRA